MESTKNAEQQTGPIIIMGEARSGTTLLRYFLDTHPNICCPGENGLLESAGGISHFISSFLNYRMSDAQMPRDLILAESDRIAAMFLRKLMTLCGKANGKKHFCCKGPIQRDLAGGWPIDSFHRIFPTSKYLIITRNCLDVVASALERQMYGTSTFYKHYLDKAPNPAPYASDYNLVSVLAESWMDKNEKTARFST